MTITITPRAILTCLVFILAAMCWSQSATFNGIPSQSMKFLSGTSSAIGGSLLTVGTPVTTTVSVTGATTSMRCLANPATGNALLTGTMVDCYVSSANTVTVRLMGIAAVTPSSQTYDVRVME